MNKGARETFVMEIPMLCTEIYSDIEPVSTAARRRGHSTGSTLTLNTGWDFRLRSHRLRALDIVRRDEPYFLLIAFPCGPWSPFQNLSTPRDRLQQLRAAARPLVNFAARLAREQLERGRHFVIENPFGSAAWKLPSLRFLRRHPLSKQVVVDMCRFGLRGPAGLLHKKPTRLLTSSPAVLSKMLNKRCTGLHQHEPVMGGSKVTTAAGHYTKEFSRALVEAFEEEFDFESYQEAHHVCVNECFEVVGSLGAVDYIHDILVEEDPEDEEGSSASEDDGKDKFVGEIMPAVRSAVRRVHGSNWTSPSEASGSSTSLARRTARGCASRPGVEMCCLLREAWAQESDGGYTPSSPSCWRASSYRPPHRRGCDDSDVCDCPRHGRSFEIPAGGSDAGSLLCLSDLLPEEALVAHLGSPETNHSGSRS